MATQRPASHLALLLLLLSTALPACCDARLCGALLICAVLAGAVLAVGVAGWKGGRDARARRARRWSFPSVASSCYKSTLKMSILWPCSPAAPVPPRPCDDACCLPY